MGKSLVDLDPYDLEMNWFEVFFPWCFFAMFCLKYNYNWYMIWYVFLFQIQHNDVKMMQPKCLVPGVKPSLLKWIKPLAPPVDSCLSNPRFPGLAHQKGPSARWRHRWVRIWSDSEAVGKWKKDYRRMFFLSMNLEVKKRWRLFSSKKELG